MSENKHSMSPTDASRIQSATAKQGGDTSSGSFPARAQSAAATNANAGSPAGAKSGSPGGSNAGSSGGKSGILKK